MKYIIGFILNFIATILLIILSPIGILSSVILTWWNKTFKDAIILLDEQQENIAISKDVVGNIILGPIFNKLFLIKESKYKFGIFPQTISYVLGANEIHGTLSLLGYYMSFILDIIQKEHCIKAYNAYEISYNKKDQIN